MTTLCSFAPFNVRLHLHLRFGFRFRLLFSSLHSILYLFRFPFSSQFCHFFLSFSALASNSIFIFISIFFSLRSLFSFPVSFGSDVRAHCHFLFHSYLSIISTSIPIFLSSSINVMLEKSGQDANSIYFLMEAVTAGEMWSVVYEGVSGFPDGELPIAHGRYNCCGKAKNRNLYEKIAQGDVGHEENRRLLDNKLSTRRD